jgi:hypothetical protein
MYDICRKVKDKGTVWITIFDMEQQNFFCRADKSREAAVKVDYGSHLIVLHS